MSEETRKIRCDACGATYSIGTKTCRSCGKALMTEKEQQGSQTLHGMPVEDWRIFIGKNSDYYVDLYKKKENESIFAKFNVWTLIFGIAWFFYRKMYKTAFGMLALSVALSLIFSLLGIIIAIPEINKAAKEYEPYSVYMTYDGKKTDAYPEDNEALKNEISEAYYRYESIVEKLSDRASLIAMGSNVIYNIVLSFFSEYLYREHVLNNTIRKKGYVAGSGKGGTSLASGLFVFLFGEIVLNYLYGIFAMLLLFIITGI